MKHTPGPWNMFSYPDHVSITHNSQEPRRSGTICDLTGIGGEHDANARLIAASPDMLLALEALLRACQVHRWQVNKDEPDVITAARQVVKKANGL